MARPLLVRVGDLLRDPGSRRDLDHAVDPDDLTIVVAGETSRLATSAAEVIPGLPVLVVGEVLSMPGGVEITGTVTYDWYGACRRCLDDVDGRHVHEIREVAQHDPVDEDVLPIDGDLLDLAPLVREVVLAGLPLAPLCRDDCPGPDPDRFPTRPEAEVEAERAAEEPPADPRWGALDQLKFD